MQKKPRGRPPSPTSVRALAEQAGVSERSHYYGLQLRRSGRTDLVEALLRGEMTTAAAIRELTGDRLPDRYEKLVRAWNRCDTNEQARFVLALMRAGALPTRDEAGA